MSKVFLILAIIAAGAASYLAFENKNAFADVLAENETTSSEISKLKRSNATELAKIDDAKADLAAVEESRNEAEARRNHRQENLGKRTAAVASTKSELQKVNLEVQELTTILKNLDLPSPEALNSELEAASGEKIELETSIEEQSLLAQSLRTAINDKRGVLKSLQQSRAERAASLGVRSRRGQISAVDPSWDFAVINLGNTEGITPNDRVIVERAGQRVGMLVVKTVEPSRIVANLVPEAGEGVQAGDSVIFQQKSES